MSYKDQAIELVGNLRHRMGPSPYDIAWLARLRSGRNGDALWPDLIDWLMANQRDDGSWGGGIEYFHDRIICTLIGAIALRENGYTAEAEAAVQRAVAYLWHHLHLLARDPVELVGFELIFPTLLEMAREHGLDVPTHTWGYGPIQSAKLRLIPPDMLYSPKASIIHSLEFLGRAGDPARIREALSSNGSVGNSPATTAYYLLLDHSDKQALGYLEGVRRHMGLVNIVYPFRTLNITWVLNNLAFTDVPMTELAGPEIWQSLAAEIEPHGVGADSTFGIPDGDTTSVAVRLLRAAGYSVDHSILSRYEDKEHKLFRTYWFERNASVGTNVHALEALHYLPDYPNRREVQEQVILVLLNQRKYDVFWMDKWHASPYYATTHALVGLLKGDFFMDYFCRPAIDWLLHSQREDGSWGFFDQGTAEETAYALTALLHYNRYSPVDPEVLHRGAAMVAQALEQDDANLPPLWIEKCLYVPHEIVRSALLAALIQYEETFGRAP